MNYNFIINPLSNRKVKITTRLGKQIINNYLNYQLGGMHVALIYIGLKKIITIMVAIAIGNTIY